MDSESLNFSTTLELWNWTETNETEDFFSSTILSTINNSSILENDTDVQFEEDTAFPVQLRDEAWAIPLLVLSSINLFAIIVFEIYVLYKSCGSRHHQFLGQALLFGLFLCSILGYAFVLTPHWVVCAITRAGVGLAYATVFSTLLVKCFFLLNLHNGNYLSSAYQFLLLFFAIGIQISIFVLWLVYRPPETIWLEEEAPQVEVCKTLPLERAEYLSYVMFLLLVAVILSIRSRSLKENNKEAIYIGVAVGLIVILWVAWISVFIIFDRRYEDPAQGFGLVLTTIVVFLLVFIPKAVQLSSCRKRGSTNGSHSMIYSPSFLHLQPHAVLPSSTEGTLIKQQSAAADFKIHVKSDSPSHQASVEGGNGKRTMNGLTSLLPSSNTPPTWRSQHFAHSILQNTKNKSGYDYLDIAQIKRCSFSLRLKVVKRGIDLNSPDYCRGFSSAFLRYDYPTFYQMEPRNLCHSDRSSQRKSNFDRNWH